MARAVFRKRRITTIDKVLPPVAEVRSIMAGLQKDIVEGEYTDDAKQHRHGKLKRQECNERDLCRCKNTTTDA